MKIKGYNKVTKLFEATYKQPFPLLTPKDGKDTILNGEKVEIIAVRSKVNFEIDGDNYGGYLCYLLKRGKKNDKAQ